MRTDNSFLMSTVHCHSLSPISIIKMLLLTDRYLVLLRKEDTDIVTPRLSMTKYTHNIVRYFVENTCDT